MTTPSVARSQTIPDKIPPQGPATAAGTSSFGFRASNRAMLAYAQPNRTKERLGQIEQAAPRPEADQSWSTLHSLMPAVRISRSRWPWPEPEGGLVRDRIEVRQLMGHQDGADLYVPSSGTPKNDVSGRRTASPKSGAPQRHKALGAREGQETDNQGLEHRLYGRARHGASLSSRGDGTTTHGRERPRGTASCAANQSATRRSLGAAFDTHQRLGGEQENAGISQKSATSRHRLLTP